MKKLENLSSAIYGGSCHGSFPNSSGFTTKAYSNVSCRNTDSYSIYCDETCDVNGSSGEEEEPEIEHR